MRPWPHGLFFYVRMRGSAEALNVELKCEQDRIR